MALKPPSFFDDLPRMRTVSRRHSPTLNYRPLLDELLMACKRFPYLAISPQNLSRPAPLVPAVVAKDKRSMLEFVDPKIVSRRGARARYEACANIFLMRAGKKFHIGVRTVRPTFLMLSYRTADGAVRYRKFFDSTPPGSLENNLVGAICHEIDHLKGRLIVDIAREDLIERLRRFKMTPGILNKWPIAEHMPFVVERRGDAYILRHGSEYLDRPIPDVSPDVFFMAPHWGIARHIDAYSVPRERELIRIRQSRRIAMTLEALG